MIDTKHGGERVVCIPCSEVLDYRGKRAWLTDEGCIEDCEPGVEWAVMAPPLCGNTCDRPIEKDGYCLKCWPKCHLVECKVASCDNNLVVQDAEEYEGYCADHRPTYTRYSDGSRM